MQTQKSSFSIWHVCLPRGTGISDYEKHAIMYGIDASVFKRWMKLESTVEYADQLTIHFYRANHLYKIHPFYITTGLRALVRDLWMRWALAGRMTRLRAFFCDLYLRWVLAGG